jgi:hypothetical protein
MGELCYRVLLTGSRTWDRPDVIHSRLDAMRAAAEANGYEFVLVHGGCPKGADLIGHQWALYTGTPCEVYPADWRRYGRSAGAVRNSMMIDTKPDEVIGFLRDNSGGTSGCLNEARARGLRVTQVDYDEVHNT